MPTSTRPAQSGPKARANWPARLAVAAAIALVAFLLGWLVGSDDQQPAAAPAATGIPVSPSQVKLRFDAGGLTLIPDARLHLPPIEPLELDELEQAPPPDARNTP